MFPGMGSKLCKAWRSECVERVKSPMLHGLRLISCTVIRAMHPWESCLVPLSLSFPTGVADTICWVVC